MSLLLADLRSLANLPREKVGRRLLTHALVGMGLLAFLSWWIASTLLARPDLIAQAHQRTGNSLQGLIGIGLMPCPIAATWLGLSVAQRQLFESPEFPLWQATPRPIWRGTIQILLRASCLAIVWAAALSTPFVLTILARQHAPLSAYALVPVAVITATVPLMATLLVAQIALVRLFAGRALRLFLTIVAAVASVGFATWLLLTISAGEERAEQFAAVAATPESLPWTVDSGATLLTAAVNGIFDLDAMRSTLWWLLYAATVFWIGARLHPRALEAHRLAEPPLRRRPTNWPGGMTAVFRRKEIAQLLQQPGALVGFLIFAFLVFALVQKQVLVGSILGNWRLPVEVRHVGALLTHWFLATVLVLYPHMGRLVLWDSTQWSLYQTAPGAPGAILRGKLQAIGLLLLWPLLLVAVLGSHFNGASPRTLLLFVGLATPGILVALGVLAFVGTLPWLVRPDEGSQIAQGGRNFFASLLLILLFELAISPAFVAWWKLTNWARHNQLSTSEVNALLPWVLGGAWACGLGLLALGTAIGGHNFRRLTLPR